MVFLEAAPWATGFSRYGSPNRSQGNVANPGYQPFNPDGSRNVDPASTDLTRRDQEYNAARKWFDPGGIFSKKRSPPRTYLWNDKTGGPDALLKSFEGGETSSQAIQRLLTEYKGNPAEIADFMETFGPTMGALEANRLERSDAFQYMQDTRNWDLGAYAGYGRAAGTIGQQTSQAQRQAGESMARSGLGRSSANVALQQMLGQQGAFQQANLQSQTEQQAAQNRMASATQMQDAYRLLAQMTMAQGLLPRITSPQGDGGGGYGGIAGGAMAGAQLGAAAGPWGALIGGLAGAGAGYAASK